MRKQDFYIIKSCFHDDKPAADPTDDGMEENESFWNNNAIVFGSEPVDEKTITSVCPWTGINENNRLGSLFK
jgi:hypothetical protein